MVFFQRDRGKNVYKSYGFTNRFQVFPPSIPKKEVKKKRSQPLTNQRKQLATTVKLLFFLTKKTIQSHRIKNIKLQKKTNCSAYSLIFYFLFFSL